MVYREERGNIITYVWVKIYIHIYIYIYNYKYYIEEILYKIDNTESQILNFLKH